MKYSYDAQCEDLARHFYPDAKESAIKELSQRLQDCAEDFDMELSGTAADLASAVRVLRANRVPKAPQIDEGQRLLNGGSYCFHIESDGRYCGRGERWAGHGTPAFHAFVAVQSQLKAEAPPEPGLKTCEHLDSELLTEKQTAGEPLFQMHKCLDCEVIFRVRSSLKTGGSQS